ncbi:glycosyltransferase family 39 protein [Candidatus Daviesbacteria bacterium]|nr:glycosyltransferase family 39 protein [Candidatus Daviesbacteria bacterium]
MLFLRKVFIRKNILPFLSFVVVAAMAIWIFDIKLAAIKSQELIFYSDDAIYATMAKRFLQGEYYKIVHLYWPGGYPLVMAITYSFFNNWEFAARLVPAIFSFLLPIATYIFFARYASWKIGLIMSIMIATFPIFHTSSIVALTEHQYVFFLYCSFFLGYLALTSKKWFYLLLAPTFFGLTYWTRQETQSIFYTFLVLFFIYQLFIVKTKGVRVIRNLVIMFLIFNIVLLPYLGTLSIRAERPVLSPVKAALAFGPAHVTTVTSDGSSNLAQDAWSIDHPNLNSEFYGVSLSSKLWKGRDALISSAWDKFLANMRLLSQFFQGFYIYLILIGAVASLIVIKDKFTIYLMANILPQFILLMMISQGVVDRYVLWLMPVLLILQGWGVYAIWQVAGMFLPKPMKIIWQPLVIIVIIFVIAKNNIALIYGDLKPGVPSLSSIPQIKEQGEWIKNYTTINRPKIMTRREGYAWYADGEIIYFPHTTSGYGYEVVVRQIKEFGVDYVLVDRDIQEQDLLFMFDPSQVGPPLTHIKTFDNNAVVYEIDKSWFEKPNEK